jgi:hypothetical protein
MYPLRKTSKGIEFTTSVGVVYNVYFTQLSQFNHYQFKSKHLKVDDFYYFGIERMTKKTPSSIDRYLKQTIAFIIVQFFVDNENCIIVFNYSNDQNRIKGRRKMFKGWYDNYSKHSIHQMYQHDYSDEISLCAVYNRRGGLEFEELRDDIQGYIQSIGPHMQSLKNP